MATISAANAKVFRVAERGCWNFSASLMVGETEFGVLTSTYPYLILGVAEEAARRFVSYMREYGKSPNVCNPYWLWGS